MLYMLKMRFVLRQEVAEWRASDMGKLEGKLEESERSAHLTLMK